MENNKKKTFELKDLFVKNSLDVPYLIILIVILALGLVMLLSSSYFNAYYNKDGDSLFYFKRQVLFIVSGLLCMWFVSKLDYKYLKAFGIILMGLAFLFLIAVLLIPQRDDIRRWIFIGPIQFQPSEFAKMTMIIVLARFLSQYNKKMISDAKSKNAISQIWHKIFGRYITVGTMTMLYHFIFVLVIAVFVAAENHLSGTILILGIGITMIWLGEGRARWFLIAGATVIIGGIFLLSYIKAKNYQDINLPFIKPYMVERIQAWLDKDFDPLGARWQTNQSLYAIGSGGFLGAGLGNSKEKYLYVSEPQNDFIFAIVCEELGFVGAVVVFILYALLILRGFYIGSRAKDRFGALLAFGMISQLALQVVLNIGVVSDLLPNTGIGLPFFSYGGTSMLIGLTEMGIVLGVSRQANLPRVYSFKKKKIKKKAVVRG